MNKNMNLLRQLVQMLDDQELDLRIISQLLWIILHVFMDCFDMNSDIITLYLLVFNKCFIYVSNPSVPENLILTSLWILNFFFTRKFKHKDELSKLVDVLIEVIGRNKSNVMIVDKCFGILSNMTNDNDFIKYFMKSEIITLLLEDVENLEGKNEYNDSRKVILISILSNLCSGSDSRHTEVNINIVYNN